MTLTSRCATLDVVKRFPAVLIGLVVLALLALGAACGGDDGPELGSGPVEDVDGVWTGTYMAADGSQSGAFCVNFEQDNRGLKGKVKFGDHDATDIGGVITETTLLFTWGAGLQTTPDATVLSDINVGGTMNGTVAGTAATGTWIAASTADVHGDWTAAHVDSGECG